MSKMTTLILVVVSAVVVIGLSIWIDGDDKEVEEVAEVIMEDVLEDELHLEDGSLKGKIDLTPGSKEGASNDETR